MERMENEKMKRSARVFACALPAAGSQSNPSDKEPAWDCCAMLSVPSFLPRTVTTAFFTACTVLLSIFWIGQ